MAYKIYGAMETRLTHVKWTLLMAQIKYKFNCRLHDDSKFLNNILLKCLVWTSKVSKNLNLTFFFKCFTDASSQRKVVSNHSLFRVENFISQVLSSWFSDGNLCHTLCNILQSSLTYQLIKLSSGRHLTPDLLCQTIDPTKYFKYFGQGNENTSVNTKQIIHRIKTMMTWSIRTMMTP